jgi:RNA polymerase sigma factor (sigma-70 family)
VPLLTLEQEQDLLARAKQGDVEAGRLLVLRNVRYVLKLASRYFYFLRSEDEFNELVQAGCLGLAEAVLDYESEDGAPFLACAKWHVMNRVSIALRAMHQTIVVPPDVCKSIWAGEQPEPGSSRERLLEKGRRALAIRLRDQDYFDRMITWDDDAIEAADIRMDRRSVGLWLHDMLGCINLRDAAVIVLRNGLGGRPPMTLAQVGKVFGLTRERIRSLEYRGVRRLSMKILRLHPREWIKLIEIECDILSTEEAKERWMNQQKRDHA